MKFLIITNNESSEYIRITRKCKHSPIVKRTLSSDLHIFNHHTLGAIIIDRESQVQELLQLFFNHEERFLRTPILIRYDLISNEDWSSIIELGGKLESVTSEYFEDWLKEFKQN